MLQCVHNVHGYLYANTTVYGRSDSVSGELCGRVWRVDDVYGHMYGHTNANVHNHHGPGGHRHGVRACEWICELAGV